LKNIKPIETKINSLTIRVDPRIELLSVIQWLSNYGKIFRILTPYDSQYKSAMLAHFSSLKKHEAVLLLNEIISRPMSVDYPPFAFGAPIEVMLHLMPDFTLNPAIFSNAFLVKRAGGEKMLQRLKKSLRRFYQDSRFQAFFEECRPIYEQIVRNNVAAAGEKDYIGELEAFYGMKQGSYTFILAPLYAGVGFGPNITIDGVRHTYEILGSSGVENGLPVFNHRFDYMQRHEFSHTFVNPLTEEFWPQMRQHFADYASTAEAQEIVNESTIRAITTWFAYLDSREAGDLALQQEIASGFPLVEPLLGKINDYAANRVSYPTFHSFYHNLAGIFEGHRKQEYDSLGKAIEQMRISNW